MKKVAFHTFGCKLNFAETSSIAQKFRADGYEVVSYKEEADLYVIHSCTVTEIAEKKCRALIRQTKKRHPLSKLAVTGCYVQMRHKELAQIPEIDILIGNDKKYNISAYHQNKNNQEGEEQLLAFKPAFSQGDRTRTFLKVQDGCDYFCTYCTIPFARGRSRSASIEESLKVAQEAEATGAAEIVLTGVNVGDFGKHQGENFLGLLNALDELKKIKRIRLSSVEPELLNEEIIQFIAQSKLFEPHFHIPLQSGSDRILSMMKRKYDTKLFASRVLAIKKLLPLACIAVDIIAGFPGETEEDHQNAMDFVRSLPISYLHVFTYSERPGTKALEIKPAIDVHVRRERSHELQRLSDEKKRQFYLENTNNEANVLFEHQNINGFMYGFTENYIRVKSIYNEELTNTLSRANLHSLDLEEAVFNI